MRIWTRDRLLILAAVGALMLTGCDAAVDYKRAEIEYGIACIESGGNWEVLVTDNMKRGYDMVCTFKQPEELTTTEEEWDAEHAVCDPIQDLGEWEECIKAIDAGVEWQGLGA